MDFLFKNDNKTVLITGADGFTGYHLTAALSKKGFNIFGVGREQKSNPIITPCDLTNKKEIWEIVERVRPDFIVHLAAVSFVGESDIESFYRVNLFGTMNLLEALSHQNPPPKKIIIASSANVYGSPRSRLIDESLCLIKSGVTSTEISYPANLFIILIASCKATDFPEQMLTVTDIASDIKSLT